MSTSVETPLTLRRNRIAAGAAVSYVLFFLLSLALPSALGMNGDAPIFTPYSSDDTVARYLAETTRGQVAVGAFFQAMSALALLAFVPYAAEYARRAVPEGMHASLIRAGGITSATLLLVSSSVQWVANRPSVGADLHLYRAVMDIVFITGAAPHVATAGLLVGAIALAAHRTRTLPSWLNWFGLVIAAFSMASMLSLLAEPATIFIPLGRYLAMIWFLGVAVALLLRGRV